MVCLTALLVSPAATSAHSVNGGTAAPGGDPAAPPSPLGATAPASTPTSGPTGPNTLQPPSGATTGSVALVRGRLTPGQAGRRVVLEVFDARRGWSVVGGAKADAGAGFVVGWRPKRAGRFRLRASAAGRAKAAGAAASPTATIEVYRSVIATWFGPGSYGSRTACGQILTPELVGVAHRTLPCGTVVDIVYGHRTISVPVVDRGPYANGATYDLTTATAQSLGVSGTVRIGALATQVIAPAGP